MRKCHFLASRKAWLVAMFAGPLSLFVGPVAGTVLMHFGYSFWWGLSLSIVALILYFAPVYYAVYVGDL